MTDDIQNGTQPGLVADAVRELEGDLKSESGGRRWLRRLLVVGVVVGLLVAFVAWRRATRPPPEPRFKTEKIEKRDVVEQVQSTGSVKPLTEVQVGAQVSGRVVRVLVDFNSVVKKGDLLAEIDPSLFGAQVSQAGAQLRASKASEKRAEARLATAKINLNRLKGLQKEGIASSADVDSAQGEFDVAEADVSAAKAQISQIQAQLRSARTTLAYSRIYSPIDGVVINRTVEPGQTVAASFAALAGQGRRPRPLPLDRARVPPPPPALAGRHPRGVAGGARRLRAHPALRAARAAAAVADRRGAEQPDAAALVALDGRLHGPAAPPRALRLGGVEQPGAGAAPR